MIAFCQFVLLQMMTMMMMKACHEHITHTFNKTDLF